MIRQPLGLRLNPDLPIRDQIYQAARFGAKGVVLDAIGDLAPHRLGETGRRELRHILRTVELELVALSLPTRRPFDTTDELDVRIRRADSAFGLAYDLGTRLVLVRAGGVPEQEGSDQRKVFDSALDSLARHAEHRGVRLALETGSEGGTGLASFLASLDHPSLGASIDAPSLLGSGVDPVSAVRELQEWVAHAYAPSGGPRPGPQAIRRSGLSAAALSWEEYLGALEEIGYRGFLTVWPDPSQDVGSQFSAVSGRLSRLH
ncbi:MAG: TIM barrel protein [Isosphaeraceae bacterium]